MDRNMSSFTVLFQPPFWVGIAQHWDEEGYQAARVVFGAEPTEPQLYNWVLREWYGLRFSQPSAEESPEIGRKNPKRLQREARTATGTRVVGTKAQEALRRQREQEGLKRQIRRREERQEEAERRFLLRQQKKREKKRGR